MREPDQPDSRICLFTLFHKEQIIFHLSTELDGRYLSAMPTTEGDIIIVDIPIASLYLAQQSALWTL